MNKDIKEEINNVMDDMNSDEEVLIYYDKEQHEQAIRNTLIAEAVNEGKKEEKIEIAKNLLKENIDINIISKTTDLSIEEINNIK